PSPVDITITSNDTTVVTVSDTATAAGGALVTFPSVANTAGRTYYAQGHAIGNTTLTVQANGYNTRTVNVEVDPSGFVLLTSSFTTRASSPNVALDIRSARLDPVTLNYLSYQPIRGGRPPVSVTVTSSSGAGNITLSPITFNAASFLPVTAT